jgi:hypothetical protein
MVYRPTAGKALTRKGLLRYTVIAVAVIALLNALLSFIDRVQNGGSRHPSKETLQSLFLTDAQCKATFPGLTKEIDDAVARGPFRLEKLPADYTGLVQGRIRDGKIYIISAERNPSRDMGYVGCVSSPTWSCAYFTSTGAKFCPPPTSSCDCHVSRTGTRHCFHSHNPRYTAEECVVFLPLERSKVARELLGDATFQQLVLAEAIYWHSR